MPKTTFEQDLDTLEASKKPPCAVCHSKDREQIETARARGVNMADIVKVMIKRGDIKDSVRIDRARSWLKEHFEAHPKASDLRTN